MTLQGVIGALVESCTLGLEFNQMQDMYYRTTYGSSFNSEWVFLKFCQAHMCTIQEPSRRKSFLERFLKKIDFKP